MHHHLLLCHLPSLPLPEQLPVIFADGCSSDAGYCLMITGAAQDAVLPVNSDVDDHWTFKCCPENLCACDAGAIQCSWAQSGPQNSICFPELSEVTLVEKLTQPFLDHPLIDCRILKLEKDGG